MEIDDTGSFPSESDHNWIFINLKDNYVKLEKNKQKKKIPTWTWNIKEEQDWDDYNNDLINDIGKIDRSTIETFSDLIINNITKSMQKNIGKIKI